MEKFLFSKVETWVVLLLALAGFIGTILFGWVVFTAAEKKYVTNPVHATALELAKVPKNLFKLTFGEDTRFANRTERFTGRGGWAMAEGVAPIVGDGYLLLSRYSGDENRALVELVDLSDFSTKFTWRFDAEKLLEGVARESKVTSFERWNQRLFEIVHPLLLPGGDLVVKDHQSPLFRLGPCSQMIWRQSDDLAHHSTEPDADGNLWVPTLIDPGTGKNGPLFVEDGIVKVSPDGKVLFNVSLPELLERSGYKALMYTAGGYRDDALHLNDIQPVLADGPHWKKGDLFLSLRHLSMILQYRPSTDQIVWLKQGPWLAQHDIDIIDDHRIAVFNNNAYDRGNGWYIDGTNDITFYDFSTDSVSSPFRAAMESSDVKSLTEGLFDFTAQGRLIVEEENSGRLLIFAQDGTLLAEFINRADDGEVYGLGWSRYVPDDIARSALAALSATDCNAPQAQLP